MPCRVELMSGDQQAPTMAVPAAAQLVPEPGRREREAAHDGGHRRHHDRA